ncbi:MAG: hypothetical protein AABX54_00710 [Nanoarchaeota archaeon]
MEKRLNRYGQVSGFVIFAILIAGIILIFFLFRTGSFQNIKVNPVALPVYNYVDACVKETGKTSLYDIGQSGGYFINPEISLNSIAVYFDRGDNYIPSKEKIQEELALYMNNILFFCVKGFSNFPDFDVSQDEIKTSAKIENNRVVFDIVYPISVTKNGKTYAFEKFSAEVPVRLGMIYNVSEKIIQEQMKNLKDICLTCLSRIAFENDLFIDMADYENDSVLFVISDENSKINGKEYKFYFINKY